MFWSVLSSSAKKISSKSESVQHSVLLPPFLISSVSSTHSLPGKTMTSSRKSMGTNASKVGQMDKKELERVRSSWKVIMENPEENGVFIFKTFLDKHNYYSYFQKFADVPVKDLPNFKVFRKHAASILQAINNVIMHLGEESLLRNDLLALGRLHGKKKVTEEQFGELQTVILDILGEKFKLSEESISAWRKTFDIAFVFIFEGLKEKQ